MKLSNNGCQYIGRFAVVVFCKSFYLKLLTFNKFVCRGRWSNLLTVYLAITCQFLWLLTTVCIDIDLTQASHLVMNKLHVIL